MTLSAPKRILVIDDDEDVMEILRIALMDEGFDVIFTNKAGAIAAIEKLCPDLVLLDVQRSELPLMGTEMCSKLKKRHVHNHMPLILVSSGTNLGTLAKDCDANLFISKPFDIFQLLVHVKRFLD
ncbi:Response regulator receiver domain-containing protein [Pedobacter westerhofensis]|uniref:Response regulator receiver domain-containing protein n=1 Tax=Pedobacter westerhofensis TaxID=425512 RepID=A0A521FL97_9SPHI|nr:response regulator [Pedobacter westerhofensis]SMO96972.1 Response regulator receiver domain-containing protein [Pedobacter westerhofensis]